MKFPQIPYDEKEPSPQRRVKVCTLLSQEVGIEYARELEQSVFVSNPSMMYRVVCCEAMATILSKESDLFVYHSPHELVTLIMNEMENPSDNPEFKKVRQKALEYKSILEEGVKKIDNLSSGTGLLRCSRCKGVDITTDQRQTRSADEGMSVFACCRTCFKKWKM